MYALQIVLVLVGYLVLTNLLDRPNLGWAAAVAATAAALLYNHYWSMYLVTIVGFGLIIAAVRAPANRRRGPLYGLAALLVAGLAFVSAHEPRSVIVGMNAGSAGSSVELERSTTKTMRRAGASAG